MHTIYSHIGESFSSCQLVKIVGQGMFFGHILSPHDRVPEDENRVLRRSTLTVARVHPVVTTQVVRNAIIWWRVKSFNPFPKLRSEVQEGKKNRAYPNPSPT